VLALATLLVAVALVIPPVLAIVYSGFHDGITLWEGTNTLDIYKTLLAEPITYRAAANTAVFATASALLSVTLATVLGLIIGRTDAVMRRVLFFAMIAGFATPVIMQTMGWTLILGPSDSLLNAAIRGLFGPNAPAPGGYSMATAVFAQSVIVVPAMYFIVAPGLANMDPYLEEAASMAGARQSRILWRVTLPLAAPSLLAAALLSFVFAAEAFEVPALIALPGKIPMLSTDIFLKTQETPADYSEAGAIATILMVLVAVILAFYQRVTLNSRRFAVVSGKGKATIPWNLGGWRWPVGLIGLVMATMVFLPTLTLLYTSFIRSYVPPSPAAFRTLTFEHYVNAFQHSQLLEAMWTSFLLGVTSGACVMFLTVIAGWVVVRRGKRAGRIIDQVASLPLVIPAIVLSLAVLRVYIRFPILIYGTVWILVLAFVIHYLPIGMRFTVAGMVALHPELEEAASMAGASLPRIARRVLVPLLRISLVSGFLWIGLASLQQLPLALFLGAAGTTVVPLEMWSLWQNGTLGDAAASAMVVVVAVLALVGVLYRVGGLRDVRTAY